MYGAPLWRALGRLMVLPCNAFGVSRRPVVGWPAGGSHPTAAYWRWSCPSDWAVRLWRRSQTHAVLTAPFDRAVFDVGCIPARHWIRGACLFLCLAITLLSTAFVWHELLPYVGELAVILHRSYSS